MAIVKVGWSGGKDSTATVLLHLQRGDTVKAVCYIPMFTKEIPLILKKHYQFILNTADYFRSLGAEVFIVSGMTYCDYVLHRATRGEHKGRIFGFPCFIRGKCGFKRDSKMKAVQQCDVGYYDYESIGIAWDEKSRHNQLDDKKNQSLLKKNIHKKIVLDCAWNITLIPPFIVTVQEMDVLCALTQKRKRGSSGSLTIPKLFTSC